MPIQRFFGNFDLTRKTQRITDGEMLHQILDVLRLREGDLIMVADGRGHEAAAKILTLGKGYADIVVQKPVENRAEPERAVTLYCAVLKRENFEWVVQKATEVGVKEVVPIITKRTVKLGLNIERLNKIAQEAAEQSGRGVVPRIHETLSFPEAFAREQGQPMNILFDMGGEEFSKVKMPKHTAVALWIGPEGGWDHEELGAAKAGDFKIANLGELILRGETAAVVASYLAVRM